MIWPLEELLRFGLKQAWASVFSGVLLAMVLVNRLLWTPAFPLSRYDFLFCAAVTMQALLVLTKLESWQECRVIFLFHIIGTTMELFKTHVGAWVYPEPSFLRLASVPLFAGFLYSSVGSYIARVWRIFHFRFINYPKRWLPEILCLLIYANFFTHHYFYDLCWFLFVLTGLLYARTWVYFQPHQRPFRMPLVLGFVLVSFFIWIAENVATRCAIWVYPNQEASWHLVPGAKLGSWFLLMIISFVLVSRLHRVHKEEGVRITDP